MEQQAARPRFRRAVISGGAGFLGSHLCERLLAAGTEVVCLDNFITGDRRNLESFGDSALLHVVEGDASKPWEVSGAVDLVVHMASPASPRDYHRLPIETMLAGSQGCLHGLELAAEHDARFLLASTSEVYGDPLRHPQPEEYWGNVNPVGPRSVYDEAKRYAEALTTAFRRQRGVRTGIARIFNTYGPRMNPDDGRMVPSFVCRSLRGQPLRVTGTGEQTRSVCYVTDTVSGLLALAAAEEEGPFNIGNPDEYSVLRLAETIRQLTGSASPIEITEAVVDDPRRRCPEITRARTLLGWAPEVDARDGLSRTVEWFREMPGVAAVSGRLTGKEASTGHFRARGV